MKIGILKETKDGEQRVACTPQSALILIEADHDIYIQSQAGLGSGFSDREYEKIGAVICQNAENIYQKSTLIYKVKEIEESDYPYLKEHHIILSFLHTNSNEPEMRALLTSKCLAIAYEDITDETGEFPILKPMSELAGKVAFIEGLSQLQTIHGGVGVLLNSILGLPTPRVVVIGPGHAGRAAAELAASFGNHVILLGRGLANLEKAQQLLPKTTELLYATKDTVRNACLEADLIINCVLWPKNREGHLIEESDLKELKPGCLIVDVSCDEGGAIETSYATTISNPTYEVAGIRHYCVDNLPALYGRTATLVLSNATLPYVLELANKGGKKALSDNPHLRQGVSTYKGKVTLMETARKFSMEYYSIVDMLN